MTTKVRLLHITLRPGQRHGSAVARELLEAARGKALIGDTGYDFNDFIKRARQGMKPGIQATSMSGDTYSSSIRASSSSDT